MKEHLIRPENSRTNSSSENSSIKKDNLITKTENGQEINTSMKGINQFNESFQMKSQNEELPFQGKFENYISPLNNKDISRLPIQKKENQTGLPDSLKTGVEHLSGMDLSDIRVHYNSAKPSEINALAYAQGNDIHLSSGEEKHLPHEAWHVVQQRQGRVNPTFQLKENIQINNETGLEREADQMGVKASSLTNKDYREGNKNKNQLNHSGAPIQRMVNLNTLNQKDKQTYETLVKKVQEHNLNCPSYRIQIDRYNTREVTTIQQLFKAVNTAIYAAAQKAQAAAKQSVDISTVDQSKLVALEPKKNSEVETPPKPKMEKTQAVKELSEIEKLELSLNNSVGSSKPKMQQREDFNLNISNQKLQDLVGKSKPPNISVSMKGYSKVTSETIYFPITIIETVSSTKTNTYDFEIHYHPNKTGNWLHAKKTAGSSADAQISSATHWMIDLENLQAGRTAWNFAFSETAPTLP